MLVTSIATKIALGAFLFSSFPFSNALPSVATGKTLVKGAVMMLGLEIWRMCCEKKALLKNEKGIALADWTGDIIIILLALRMLFSFKVLFGVSCPLLFFTCIALVIVWLSGNIVFSWHDTDAYFFWKTKMLILYVLCGTFGAPFFFPSLSIYFYTRAILCLVCIYVIISFYFTLSYFRFSESGTLESKK